jgi:penicillin amidase
MEDMERLQSDVVSLNARRLVTLLKPLSSPDQKTEAALRLLSTWDGEEKATSAAAALYEVWWSRHLGHAFKEAVLAPAAAQSFDAPHASVLLESLENPAQRFGADAVRKRDEVLLASLARAWAEVEGLLGPDPARWQWGKLHFSYFVHPMTPILDQAARDQVNVGPLPRGGGAYTVNVSSYHPDSFWQAHGPSFRMVLDVGNWDNSRAINTPGQSGDPASPHYRDLAQPWAEGKYFPLLYSREAVEKAAKQVIDLLPGR